MMILLVWADAHAGDNDSWVPIEDVTDTGEYLVSTVGWVVDGAKDKHVSIAQSWTQDDQVDHILHVPIGMIRQVHALSPVETQLG
jgi:hypothetical protein